MHILNRILPNRLQRLMRQVGLRVFPSMRHLDMRMRLRHMARLGFAPRTIVDVGAAEGEWSGMAASIWPEARIVAFEPRPSSQAGLEATRRALPQMTVHGCFLGATSGRVAYRDHGHQTTLYGDDPPDAGGAAMRTLDECLATGLMPQPDLLKLDVQGYEREVLAGGGGVVAGTQAVLAEVSFFRFHPEMPTADELVDDMRQRGFVIYDVMGLLRLPEDDALAQMDFMFLRHDHPLRGERRWPD